MASERPPKLRWTPGEREGEGTAETPFGGVYERQFLPNGSIRATYRSQPDAEAVGIYEGNDNEAARQKCLQHFQAAWKMRQEHRVWIFLANPQEFDLVDFLGRPSTQVDDLHYWSLRQCADQVATGDTVLLWTSGENAGIYATGTVVSGLNELHIGPSWHADGEHKSAPFGTPVIVYTLDRVLLGRPVLRNDLINHPALGSLSVMQQPVASTIFPVTQSQWEALQPMLASPQPRPREEDFTLLDDGLERLVRETHWSRDDLEEILHSLQTRRQIILSGPPGTGKTWVGKRVAEHFSGRQPGAVKVVQFHPSYAYEDFVEGLRPVASEGQVAFEVVEGALVKVAEIARQVDHPVVLLIDEINRANLPSVFGELLYLLEYRDEEIQLLHRDRFSLPPNLYIVATMNTADRSIRSVDAALRRRFDIFECAPRPDILDAYYSAGEATCEIADLAQGLRTLNERLALHLDRHHTVGHSFFMAENFTHTDLQRRWQHQIQPLIEEYFFDQPDLVAQFDVSTFWPSYLSR